MLPDILDSLLLFSLSVPVVMQYRILPVEGTPYWLFGLLFLLLVVHVVISVYPCILRSFESRIQSVKTVIAVAVICISLGGATVTAIADRAKTAPVWSVHDIILQQEAAMRYLVTGKNPYSETYFGTPVESFRYAEEGNDDAVNPALYHFVMPPWYLLFPFPIYFVSNRLIGYFDGREALIATMIILIVSLYYWYKNTSIARLAMILTALSPSVVPYFVEGRSDVFVLSWLIAAFVLLERRRFIWSAMFLALAALSKQTAWLAVPFVAAGMMRAVRPGYSKLVIPAITFAAVCLLITGPFLVWDARALYESTVGYLAGTAAHSYPVSGYGFGMVLVSLGIIRDIHAYYPFIFWQLAIAGPIGVACIVHILRSKLQASVVLSYAVFLAVYWYLSRYFNNSHAGFLSMVFVLGGLKFIDERQS